jgi:phage FluMu protein Com
MIYNATVICVKQIRCNWVGKVIMAVFGAVLKEMCDQCRTLEKTGLGDLAFGV